MNWIEYADPINWHDAASVFPLMPDDDLQKLADDVKTNGLKNAIILLDNKVLDGRNRLLACKLAGVRPNIESRNAEKLGSPVSWVLSQNLHRRQLTATQRAFVAVVRATSGPTTSGKEIARKSLAFDSARTTKRIPIELNKHCKVHFIPERALNGL